MSANCLDQIEDNANKVTTYTFRMSIPIPSYLLAIVIGNLDSRSIDSRTSIISEPDKIDGYAVILKDLGTLLNKTEEYVKHPYVWGNYTILV